MKKSKGGWILLVFLLVPFISSIISTVHLIDFVGLGNKYVMAFALAITFELGSIVSFVAISDEILKKLKKGWIMGIFAILFVLQSIGNIYSTFNFMHHKMAIDPHWLDVVMEMTFDSMDLPTLKLTLSVLIGLPIPLISLILLKSSIDYFYESDEEEHVHDKKIEPVKENIERNKAEKPLFISKEPIPEPVVHAEADSAVKEPPIADQPAQEKKIEHELQFDISSMEPPLFDDKSKRDMDKYEEKINKELDEVEKQIKEKLPELEADSGPKVKYGTITKEGYKKMEAKKGVKLPFQTGL